MLPRLKLNSTCWSSPRRHCVQQWSANFRDDCTNPQFSRN